MLKLLTLALTTVLAAMLSALVSQVSPAAAASAPTRVAPNPDSCQGTGVSNAGWSRARVASPTSKLGRAPESVVVNRKPGLPQPMCGNGGHYCGPSTDGQTIWVYMGNNTEVEYVCMMNAEGYWQWVPTGRTRPCPSGARITSADSRSSSVGTAR
jgi:hypothetical protein